MNKKETKRMIGTNLKRKVVDLGAINLFLQLIIKPILYV